MVRNLSQLGFYWHIFCCQTDESKEKLIKKGKKAEKRETDVVLTTNEAIQYLKISKPTFLKYVRLGRIRAIKDSMQLVVLKLIPNSRNNPKR